MDGYIAVIDTETNWDNCLMSVGVAIADAGTLRPVDAKYIIISPEYERGGMYFESLGLYEPVHMLFRHEAVGAIETFLKEYGVSKLFAYNAGFDRGVLREFYGYDWYDIIGVAAYSNFNDKIKPAECCKSGRLKRGYGVEAMLRRLTGSDNYFETHNAMLDAFDELTIMRLMGHSVETYEKARL
ncbi:MAG: hypothetical protein IKS90_02550 [Clostridia bacterium]|nr:hypothetical protein [Clostridia bacterium]